MQMLAQAYLDSVTKRLQNYKTIGERTFSQLEEKDFYWEATAGANSIAVIIRHMHGNMISRWTNFLTEDGEKENRDRDREFGPATENKEMLIMLWEKGWTCLFESLATLRPDDLLATITIRQEPLLAIDAINRQLAHYPYHVGQIVYLGKTIREKEWKNLSIAPGESKNFNSQMKDKIWH